MAGWPPWGNSELSPRTVSRRAGIKRGQVYSPQKVAAAALEKVINEPDVM